jgi:hypothetical protein
MSMLRLDRSRGISRRETSIRNTLNCKLWPGRKSIATVGFPLFATTKDLQYKPKSYKNNSNHDVVFSSFIETVVEKEIIHKTGDHDATTFIVKYEALGNDSRQETLNSIFNFLGKDKPTSMTQHGINECFFRDQKAGAHHVNKAAAFSDPAFVSTLWHLVQKSAERFGYSKPSTRTSQHHDSATTLHHSGEALPEGQYLTYLSSGGVLSDQLLELEIAVQLAIQSGRKLILTPLIKGDSPLIPKSCSAHTGGELCAANPLESYSHDPYWWSDIIDIKVLSLKVEVFERPHHGDIPLRFSELTLCEFDRCNTQWGLHEPTEEGEECVFDFSFGPRTSFNISEARATRSTRCLFEATKEVGVLRFVDLIGTVDRKFVSAQVDYTEHILDSALEEVLEPIRNATGGGAMYVCAELKTSRDDAYLHTQSISEQLEAYFKEMDSDNKILVYMSIGKHKMEKEQRDICTNRTCIFARDYYTHDTKNFPFSAFDSYVCSQAHRVFTLYNETDWYTERIHRRRHSGGNLDACPFINFDIESESSSVDNDEESSVDSDDESSSIDFDNENEREKCRMLSITKESESAQNNTDNAEGHGGFGGCLLIMDGTFEINDSSIRFLFPH